MSGAEFDDRIAPCKPSSPARLAEMRAMGFPDGALGPGLVDDTLMDCPKCGGGMWVGPRKKFLASLGQCKLLCYLCATEFFEGLAVRVATGEFGGVELVEVDLNPGRVEVPRHDGGAAE